MKQIVSIVLLALALASFVAVLAPIARWQTIAEWHEERAGVKYEYLSDAEKIHDLFILYMRNGV